MKKLLALSFAIITLIAASAQTKQSQEKAKDTTVQVKEQPKVYTLQFNDYQLYILSNAMEQSNLSHVQIEGLKAFIAEQLKKQTETKPK